MNKPKTLAYTTHEGGHWIECKSAPIGPAFHSILFEDGRVWDTVFGWRPRAKTKEQIASIVSSWEAKSDEPS